MKISWGSYIHSIKEWHYKGSQPTTTHPKSTLIYFLQINVLELHKNAIITENRGTRFRENLKK